MKRFVLSLLMLAAAGPLPGREQVSEHRSVTAYLQSLTEDPVDTIKVKIDRLIDSVGVQNPELQSKVAGIAFDFFSSSPVMGHEAVSVHIADNWFLNGRLKFEDENLYPMVHTYAEFNRSSLVGKEAPPLVMEDIHGIPADIRASFGSNKVLFFYDTECSTCRREAPLLADIARSYKGEPLTIYAIYTQSGREAWEKYVAETFSDIDNPNVQMVHLWDPEAETNFHKKYAVLSTPAMFLIDGRNVVTGRKLDCEALSQMLQMDNSQALRYKQLFTNVFSRFNPLQYSNVQGIIDAFHDRFEPEPQVHDELFLNLFNYLRTSEEPVMQQGALYLAEKYIVACPDNWPPEFLNQIVHALMKSRLNPVGSKAANLMLQDRKGREVKMIDKKHHCTILFFHLIDCEHCRTEIAGLKKLKPALHEADIQVVMIYVGNEREKWRKFRKKDCLSRWKYLNDFNGTSNMRELYDLEFVPHMYVLDENGTIIAKDINVSFLEELIPLL